MPKMKLLSTFSWQHFRQDNDARSNFLYLLRGDDELGLWLIQCLCHWLNQDAVRKKIMDEISDGVSVLLVIYTD